MRTGSNVIGDIKREYSVVGGRLRWRGDEGTLASLYTSIAKQGLLLSLACSQDSSRSRHASHTEKKLTYLNRAS
jgi:hypothetical protein